MNAERANLSLIVKSVAMLGCIKGALECSNNGLDGVEKYKHILTPEQILEIEYQANIASANIEEGLMKLTGVIATLNDVPDCLPKDLLELFAAHEDYVKRKDITFSKIIKSDFVFTPSGV